MIAQVIIAEFAGAAFVYWGLAIAKARKLRLSRQQFFIEQLERRYVEAYGSTKSGKCFLGNYEAVAALGDAKPRLTFGSAQALGQGNVMKALVGAVVNAGMSGLAKLWADSKIKSDGKPEEQIHLEEQLLDACKELIAMDAASDASGFMLFLGGFCMVGGLVAMVATSGA